MELADNLISHSKHPLAIHPIINGDIELVSILKELESCPELAFFTTHITDRIINYASPTFQVMFGYSADELKAAGPDLLFSMVDKDAIPKIIDTQNKYIEQTKKVGFDPSQPIIFEFLSLPMTSREKRFFMMHCFCLVLTYSTTGDLDFSITLFFQSDDPKKDMYKQKLIRLKNRHNEIYTHQPMIPGSSPLNLLHMTTSRMDVKITHREREILTLLANGFSTKEIASKLSVSSHTTETHRKNLLQKFEAKNSAELVNKASKIFWLE